MSTQIKVTVDGAEFEGVLNDSETAEALRSRLPLKVKMSRWGDEYYGSLGKALDVELAAEAREVMEVGELAYWVPGTALCIFFGPTPASEGEEPRAASVVNPVGRLHGAVDTLKGMAQRVTVSVAIG